MRKKILPVMIIVIGIAAAGWLFAGQRSDTARPAEGDTAQSDREGMASSGGEDAVQPGGEDMARHDREDTVRPDGEDSDSFSIEEIRDLPAHAVVDTMRLTEEEKDGLFYAEEITDEVFARIDHGSYTENADIDLSQLRYIRVLHKGIDGKTYIGELIVNQEISEDILDVMRELYRADYPIERMVLVDEYDADDEASMEANNTSAFNYRTIAGSDRLSNHSYGRAIDINPLYNPYVKKRNDGTWMVSPAGGAEYASRSADTPYKIDHDDLCYQLFAEHGFTWGGDWNSVKDYQHFEK